MKGLQELGTYLFSFLRERPYFNRKRAKENSTDRGNSALSECFDFKAKYCILETTGCLKIVHWQKISLESKLSLCQKDIHQHPAFSKVFSSRVTQLLSLRHPVGVHAVVSFLPSFFVLLLLPPALCQLFFPPSLLPSPPFRPRPLLLQFSSASHPTSTALKSTR